MRFWDELGLTLRELPTLRVMEGYSFRALGHLAGQGWESEVNTCGYGPSRGKRDARLDRPENHGRKV